MEEPRWPQWEAKREAQLEAERADREAERAEQEQADRASQWEAEWEAYLKGLPEAERPPKKSGAETSLIEAVLVGLGSGFLLLIIYFVLGAMALFLILFPIVWLARLFT